MVRLGLLHLTHQPVALHLLHLHLGGVLSCIVLLHPLLHAVQQLRALSFQREVQRVLLCVLQGGPPLLQHLQRLLARRELGQLLLEHLLKGGALLVQCGHE